jgi:hypothetical protein
MDKIKIWCSNKENIKILLMIGMAIILVVILKNRFGGTEAEKSDSSEASYENRMEPQTEIAIGGYDKGIPKRAPARSKTTKLKGPEPPPFLKRDLFFSRYSELNPKIKGEEMEDLNLELTATIVDGRGALAIIGNEVLEMGEMVNGLRVTAIKNNEVILSKGKRKYVLRINEE